MRDSKSSEEKTIKEVQELRARKPKLERVSSDITERKRTKQALKESEEKYRQIVELAPDGILTVDLKGMITSCNTSLLEGTGYSKDDFVGRHISKIPTARLRDIPKYIKMFNSLLQGNVPEPFESEWIHKDGTEHWSEAHVGVLKRHGKTIGFQVITRDVTDRKRMEDALRRNKTDWENTFNAISDWVVLMDLKGRILHSNRAGEDFTGVALAEIVGQSCCKLVHGSEKHIPGCPLKKMLRTHQRETTELQVPYTDHWMMVTVDPVADQQGKIIGAVHITRDITERKKAEEAVRESEGKYRTLFETAGDAILLVKVSVGQGARFLDCNSRALEMFGCTREQLIGKSPEDFSPPTRPDGMPTHEKVLEIAKATAQGKPQFFEWAHRRLDGTSFPAEVTLNNIEIHGETYIQAVTRDITERKKAEEALRESEERYRQLFENESDAVMIFDAETLQFEDANQATLDLLGYTKEEFLTLKVEDISAEKDKTKATVKKHKNGKLGSETIPLRYMRKKDGTIFPAEISTGTFTSKGRKKLIGAVRDITDRKRMEDALRRSKTDWENTFNAISDWIVLMDLKERILRTNRAGEEFVGVPLVQMAGQTCCKLLHGSDTPLPGCPLLKMLQSGQRETMELQLPDSNRWMVATVDPVVDEKGTLVGAVHITSDITDRKRAEAAYRALVDHSLQGLAIFQDRRAVFANQAMAEITGYTVDEILAMSSQQIQAFVHPEDRSLVWGRHRGRLKGQQLPERYEFRGIRKDATVCWLEIHASRIAYQGKPAIQAAYVDITDRKRAEETLQKTTKELQVILDSVPAGIWYKDTENRLLRVNKAGAESIGMKVEDIEGRSVCDIFPEDAEHYYEDDLEVIKSGKPKLGIVERLQVPGGEKKWVQTDKVPYRDEQGNVAGVIAFVQDITDRKKAEEALRESEERFRGIFEDSLVGMYRTTPDGRILMANPALVRMLKYPSFEELAHRNLEEEGFLSGHARSAFKERIEAEGQVIGLESAWRRRDGSTLFVRESARAVRDSEGSTLYYEGTVEDITERKQAEQKLLEDQVRLKSLASELSLAEERERRRIATELHDRIGQSLVISKMNLEALRKSEYGKKTDETLDEICNSLAQTIADTRTLTFDLSSPILYQLGFEAAVAEWLTEQIRDKHGIATQFEDDGRPKPLDDDIRVLLFRDVRELLINVIKHARADKVRVSVRRVGNKIYVTVEDDGVGFDPAEAASTAAKRAEFGLFSIRQRLEELGGHLDIESEPGRGCKVTMTAPLRRE